MFYGHFYRQCWYDIEFHWFSEWEGTSTVADEFFEYETNRVGQNMLRTEWANQDYMSSVLRLECSI